jgi:hypothetical protein
LSRGDVLLAVVQLLGGGVVGYLLGLKQGREQAQYDRRAAAVTELRRRLRETREAFANLATPSEYRRLANETRPRDELAKEAGEKLNELDGYHRDHALWLDRRTYEKLDNFTDELAFGLAEAEHRLREIPNEFTLIHPSAWKGILRNSHSGFGFFWGRAHLHGVVRVARPTDALEDVEG